MDVGAQRTIQAIQRIETKTMTRKERGLANILRMARVKQVTQFGDGQ